jgi:hypothetical protein
MIYRTAAHEAIANAFKGHFHGYIPDDASGRYQKPASLLLKASGAVAQASLVGCEAPILNQGQTGSCGGHGTTQAAYTALNAAGFSPLTVPSPRILYALARIMQRTNASQGLADSGVMPSDLLTVLRQYGIKPMAPTVTPDGRYSDVWGPGDLTGLPLAQPNVNTEPDLLDLETSGLKLLTGEYRIDESDPTLAQQILASVNAKAPGGVGIFVDSAFMSWDPSTGPIKSINLADPQGGGHWLALTYGYTTPAGVVVLGGPNSWGAEWPVTAGSGVPGSPYWKPGHWEVEAPGLQAAMSDCLLFPVKVLS